MESSESSLPPLDPLPLLDATLLRQYLFDEGDKISKARNELSSTISRLHDDRVRRLAAAKEQYEAIVHDIDREHSEDVASAQREYAMFTGRLIEVKNLLFKIEEAADLAKKSTEPSDSRSDWVGLAHREAP